MTETIAPLATKALAFLKGMPDWFKAVLLGGALVFSSFFLLGGATPAEVRAINERVAAVEKRTDDGDRRLERIEDKIDRLILHLVPHGD